MDMFLFSVGAGKRKGEFEYTPHPPFNLADGEPFKPDGKKLVTITDIIARDKRWTAQELEDKWAAGMKPFMPIPDESPLVHFARLQDLYDRRRAVKCDPTEQPPPLPQNASEDEFRQWFIRHRLCPHMDAGETREFIHLCKIAGLDPLKNEVFPGFARDEATGADRIVLGVTIQYMRQRVLASGLLESIGTPEWCASDGVWVDTWTRESKPSQCRLLVRRKGMADAIEGRVALGVMPLLNEGGNRQPRESRFWLRDPAGQLAKCALADAFRKGFQDVINGLVTIDELQNGPPATNPNKTPPRDPTDQTAGDTDNAASIDPAADDELPVTRQSFELKLADFGIRRPDERQKIITRMRIKFAALLAQDEDTFWQKAWSEFIRTSRPVAAAVE